MRLIVMFIAIALAVGAFFITMHFSSKEPEGNVPVVQPQPIVQQVPTTNIYIAKQDIPIGAQVTQEMIDIQPWPQHLKLEDMVQADPNKPNDLVKMVARVPFQKGEPIMKSMLANPNDPSFLAASLPQGMRAVTIAVDAVTGAGGFVFPGDRVDVLVTHRVKLAGETEEGNAAEELPMGAKKKSPKGDQISETFISNVRVLAVNQKAISHNGEPPTVPSSVTIEVSAADAQRIRLIDGGGGSGAAGNGRLSLVLRSLKDKDAIQMTRPTGISDLSHLTPPAYFSVIYGDDGKPVFGSPDTQDSPEARNAGSDASAGDGLMAIIVTRGVQAQQIEVPRP